MSEGTMGSEAQHTRQTCVTSLGDRFLWFTSCRSHPDPHPRVALQHSLCHLGRQVSPVLLQRTNLSVSLLVLLLCLHLRTLHTHIAKAVGTGQQQQHLVSLARGVSNKVTLHRSFVFCSCSALYRNCPNDRRVMP